MTGSISLLGYFIVKYPLKCDPAWTADAHFDGHLYRIITYLNEGLYSIPKQTAMKNSLWKKTDILNFMSLQSTSSTKCTKLKYFLLTQTRYFMDILYQRKRSVDICRHF